MNIMAMPKKYFTPEEKREARNRWQKDYEQRKRDGVIKVPKPRKNVTRTRQVKPMTTVLPEKVARRKKGITYRIIDESHCTPVFINEKLTILVRPGKDIEKVKRRFAEYA